LILVARHFRAQLGSLADLLTDDFFQNIWAVEEALLGGMAAMAIPHKILCLKQTAVRNLLQLSLL